MFSNDRTKLSFKDKLGEGAFGFNDTIEIIGRRFPIDVVFARSDITINKEIGRGNFGRVCQGYLDQGQVQRYLINDFES